MAIKGDNVVVSIKASAKSNYLLAKECSTISNSDIPSDGLSELFSDTLSWTGKWSDIDEEQMCDIEEDEVSSATAASVKIELPMQLRWYALLTLMRRIDGLEGVLKARHTKQMPVKQPDCKPDVVAGFRVQCAPDARFPPEYGDPAQPVQGSANHHKESG